MAFLTDLWLPILLSAVFVFVASSVIHMVIPFHKRDYQKLPGEDEVLETMRSQGVKPGQYMFPCPSSMKDMGSPEMLKKYEAGPVGSLVVIPTGAPRIGKSLVQWFLYSLLIGVFVAYVGDLALGAGADYRVVFRVTGTVATLGYAFSYIPDSIWKGLGWSTTLRFVVDGVVYGLLTGGTFGWLWPGAA